MSQPKEAIQIRRKPTRAIFIGPVQIGGGAPVVVQSMTNTDTRDVGATLAQIQRLAAAGCEVARLAGPDQKAARAFGQIKRDSPLPLIADIHFNHRLALASLEAGAGPPPPTRVLAAPPRLPGLMRMASAPASRDARARR